MFLTSAFDNSTSDIVLVNEVIDVPDNASDSFETAFHSEFYNTSYEEVRTLVSTQLVDHLFVSEDEGTSIAEGLMKIFGGKVKEPEIKDEWSDKKKARRIARHEAKLKTREDFLNKWRGKLGFLGGYVEISKDFANECNASIAENPLLEKVQFCAGYELEPNSKTKFGRKDNKKTIEPSRMLPIANNLGELILAVMIRATKAFTAEEKVDLVVDLDSLLRNPVMTKTSSGTGVMVEDYVFELSDATISRIVEKAEDGTLTLGRQRKAIKVIMFSHHFVVSGDVLVFVWILNSMRLSSKGLSQAINMSSNCFEETVNYGAKPGSEDIKFHVIKNMMKQATISCPNLNYFPYSNLSNCKLAVDTLDYVLQRGVHAMCDKQNKSWITINSGAEALFVGRDEEGYIINLNDMSKMTKLFNRPASCVYAWAELL